MLFNKLTQKNFITFWSMGRRRFRCIAFFKHPEIYIHITAVKKNGIFCEYCVLRMLSNLQRHIRNLAREEVEQKPNSNDEWKYVFIYY